MAVDAFLFQVEGTLEILLITRGVYDGVSIAEFHDTASLVIIVIGIKK